MEMTQPLEVGLVVADLDAMVTFYSTALGCPEVHRTDVPESIAAPSGAGGGNVTVWLQTSRGERNKLIRPHTVPPPGTPPGDGYDPSRPLLSHLLCR